MEEESKKKEDEFTKLKHDLDKVQESRTKQAEKFKKENVAVKKSLEDVIDELKMQLDAAKKVAPS